MENQADSKVKISPSLIKRLITGAAYLIVVAGLIVMKLLVPDGWGALGFDVLFCAVSVIGSVELLRALGKVIGISFEQKAISVAYCAVIIPAYVVFELVMGFGAAAVGIFTLIYVVALAATLLFNKSENTWRGMLAGLFTFAYCGVLSWVLSLVNHMPEHSGDAIILMFIIVMFTDCGAYIFGSIFSRWLPYKLAPRISPKKTIIGAVGGIIGGIVGAVVAYYICEAAGMELAFGSGFLSEGIAVFILIGFVAAIFAQAGDLFESAIKRKCGIKDMGKLLPGHGGVLDRFDSMLFCGLIILICFILLTL